ncbi:MAG: hypothetical protein OSA89_16530, partial [Mariniblastus sp.]|nr:hypothetical protein [Mariniblastus sp.]
MRSNPRLILVIAVWFVSCFNYPAHAKNNLFLPGDAFFPAELTADPLPQLLYGSVSLPRAQ